MATTPEKVSKPHERREESTSKIGAIPVLLKVELAFIKHMFTGPFRGENGASTYKRDVLYAAIRQLLGGLSTAQVQIAPGTDTTYKIASRLEHQKANSVELGGGARGNWIGKKEARRVMLYIHGGGFYGPATLGHQRYQFALQKEMQKQGHDFAIFSLSYTLSPKAVYPTQLTQAVSALRHLIEVEHRDPSTILIAGDSAGGNLASALLLHLARPHPSVPAIKLSHPLHAALLISPWVSFETEGTSFTKNARSDYITAKALRRAANAYFAVGTEHDEYSQPISAPVEWWRDVASNIVNKMMIWGGESEILIDGIHMFARSVETGFAEADKSGSVNGFVFVTSPGHAHEEMIIDFLPFMKTKGHGAVQTEEWLSTVLGNKMRNK